ncbi:MAG: GyrI-like domain-containing protein [Acidobacteria bacterium]|nr:GyrI-like domain-containing protein [Acidobacteriota bacterium]
MIETPVILTVPSRLAAAIHVTIPRNEIQAVMGPTLKEVMAVAQSQAGGPAGPWFTHHLQMDPQVFDFEVCVPVAATITGTGRVVCREFPALSAVRTTYQGPYEGLGSAWGEFGNWISTQGQVTAPDLYECYLVGPESGLDSSQWRTELTRPLVSQP